MENLITTLYKKYHASSVHTVSGEKYSIDFLGKNGRFTNYSRMLEFFAYDIDLKLREDTVLGDNLRESFLNTSYSYKFFCFGNSEVFKVIPEYCANDNHKVVKLEFITNVLEINFEIITDFDSYLAQLKKKRRYKVNKVIKDKNIKFVRCDSIEDFNSFVDMHIAQWDDNGDPSILNNKKWRSFYQGMYLSKLTILHKLIGIDGNVVAYHLGFELDDTFHYLMPTYIQNSGLESPGFALLVKLIETNYSDSNITKFSLGSGDYSYKRWLSNSSRPLFRMSVKRSILASKLMSITRKFKKIGSKYIKLTRNFFNK